MFGLPMQLLEPFILLAILFVLLRFFRGAIGRGDAGVAAWFVFRVAAVLVMVPVRILAWILRQVWETWRERHVLGHVIAGKPARRSRLARLAERSANTNPRPPEVLYGSNGEMVVLDDSDGPIGPHDFQPGQAPPDYVPDEWEDIWQAHLRRLERRKRWGWLFRWARHDDGPTGQDSP